MKYNLLITFLFFSLFLFSQEKGASPINQEPKTTNQTPDTYAVVVGISDYQDEGIPDLRFADKDALAFAGFLQSPAGGSLDEDHLKVLINEQATAAQFAIALDWLWEVVREDDRVIIYFSGHGDVEHKSITQPGYLLCWDAPKRVYMAGGTFGVNVLNDVVSTLSIQNKAKVILVTDACRAGKLSGSGIGGPQATASNLAKQYANEIKILSCQPDEYSIEGEQWGGGRGAFSYHLLDGLFGLADRNTDLSVNLMEIRSYLEENVSKEVAPQNQLPMVVGNGREKLTDVFPEILKQLQEGKRGQMQLFTPTESRGIEEEVLAQADSNIVEMYLAFRESLADQNFLCDSTETCADFYYSILSLEPQLEKLHSGMRRNYAAALQDDAQQVMNRLLESNPYENNALPFTKNKKYGRYPEILRRAANLLGKEHYMYNVIMARSYWFEGYIADRSNCSCMNLNNAKVVIPYYEKALSYQPEMPHAWFQLAAVYGIQMGDPEKGAEYANKVVESIPGWTAVYVRVANAYLNSYSSLTSEEKQQQYLNKAKDWLDRGFAVDSNSTLLYNDLGYYYSLLGDYEKEQKAYARSLAIDTLASTFNYSGAGYEFWGKYKEAEKAYQKAYELEPDPQMLGTFIFFYFNSGQDEKAEKLCSEIIEKEPRMPEYYREIGIRISHKYPKESIAFLRKALPKDSSDAMGRVCIIGVVYI